MNLSERLRRRGAREIGPYPSDTRQYIIKMAERLKPGLDSRRGLIDTRADRLRELVETVTGVISPEAAAYYDQASVQNVSVHLGFGQQPVDWRGSGTYVAPGKVLTARHVAADLEASRPSAYAEPGVRRLPRAGVVRNLDEGRVEFPIESILHMDQALDMALLQTAVHPSQRPAVMGLTPKAGARITATGADMYVPGEKLYDPSLGFKREEIGEILETVRDRTSATGYIQSGMSGGGWINEYGRLVGLNSVSIMSAGRTDYNVGEPHKFRGPSIDAVYESLVEAERRGFQDRVDLELTSGRNEPLMFHGGREPFQEMLFAQTLDPRAVDMLGGASGGMPWIQRQMLQLDRQQIDQLAALEGDLDPIVRGELQSKYDSIDAEKQGWIRLYDEYAQSGYRESITNLQEQVLRDIDGAIFQIAMYMEGREGPAAYGTGFSPSPGQLLTNMHVIQPPAGERYLLGEATRLGSEKESFDFTTFLGADRPRDTALIRIPKKFEHASIPFAEDFPYTPGTQVVAPGIPSAVENVLPGIIFDTVEAKSAMYKGQELFEPAKIFADMPVEGGASGSPILARTMEGLRTVGQVHSKMGRTGSIRTAWGYGTRADELAGWLADTMATLPKRPYFLSSLAQPKLLSGRAVEPVTLPSGLIAAEHMTENLEALRSGGAVTPAAQTGRTQLSTTGLHRFARDPESAFFSAYPSYRHRFPEGFAFDPEMLIGEFGGAVRERPFDASRFINTAIRDVQSEFEGGYRATGVPDELSGGPVDIILALEGLMGQRGEVLDTPAREVLEMARADYDAMRVSAEMTGMDAMEFVRSFAERATRGEVGRPYPEIVVDRPVPLSRAYGEFTDAGLQLMSGRADWDKHPNVFYSPLSEGQVMGDPARDTDPGNYRYLLNKIMGARTREEVQRILEPAHRTYDPKRGVQFSSGQLGVNRASQLVGLPDFRDRGTVFQGELISDTVSRQGSLVLPQEILATGGSETLGLQGLEPEIWQPRRGYAGGAALLPAPGDTDITGAEVLRHIRGLPRGEDTTQIEMFDRQLQARPVDFNSETAKQIKLFSGAFGDETERLGRLFGQLSDDDWRRVAGIWDLDTESELFESQGLVGREDFRDQFSVKETLEMFRGLDIQPRHYRDQATSIYQQFSGYQEFIGEHGQLHPMDMVNDWIGDAMTEGIPAIEDNLLDWKRRASLVKRRWTDFEKAVREGQTVRPAQGQVEARGVYERMLEMYNIQQETDLPVQSQDLRRALENVGGDRGLRGVESNLDYYKGLLVERNKEWTAFLETRADFMKRAETAGLDLKEVVRQAYFDRNQILDVRDPRVLQGVVSRQLDAAQPQPQVEQLQFVRARGQRPSQRIEPLGRGLAGKRTYGFELEFMSHTELDDIEEALGSYNITIERDLSVKDAEGAQTSHIIESIYENLKEQLAGSGYDADHIREMAIEEAEFAVEADLTDRELISPVYQGEADIRNVDSILRDLEQFDPYINETAGLHVHVGSEGLTSENYINLLGNYLQREPVIDMVHDVQRRGRGSEFAESLQLLDRQQLQMPLIPQQGFGQRGRLTSNLEPGTFSTLTPLNRTVMEQAFKNYLNSVAAQTMPSVFDLTDDFEFGEFRNRVYGGRYQKLNIRGHELQTVEYRQPAATLDPQRIENQIRFITNFIDKYKDVPFEPGPGRNIAETFQELGFKLSEVQEQGYVDRLQRAATGSDIELLSGRNMDQDLYDMLVKAQAESQYTFDVGKELTRDQTFDILGQFVEGVEDYFGFGVRENPYAKGAADIFADSSDLNQIFYHAKAASKAIEGRQTFMPPIDPSNFGYTATSIRKFFEDYGTIGAKSGLEPELMRLLKVKTFICIT